MIAPINNPTPDPDPLDGDRRLSRFRFSATNQQADQGRFPRLSDAAKHRVLSSLPRIAPRLFGIQPNP